VPIVIHVKVGSENADFGFFVYQLDRCKLSDTHTKSHKLICPGHDAPQSMAYSFTSVCNCLYTSGEGLRLTKTFAFYLYI
jgi:hypothetical protein